MKHKQISQMIYAAATGFQNVQTFGKSYNQTILDCWHQVWFGHYL